MSTIEIDVLIVGAGPSGLALATEMTSRGHRVHIIEKNARTGVQPRAKTTNVRTMTHMRRWGLSDAVRRRSPLSEDFPRRVVYQTRVFAEPIFSFDDAFCASPRRRDEFPEHAEFIPQYVIEGILAGHIANEPLATLEFGQELVSFTDEGDCVVAYVREADGSESAVRARYIVGADGGRSTLRHLLGIEMKGTRNLETFVTLILRIPGLTDAPGLPKALFHWIVNPDAACIVGPMDQGDLWYLARVAGRTSDTSSILEIAKAAIGGEWPIQVEMRDDWVVHSLMADRYRNGRAFLIGDACHLHSPFGGHGMNLGIGDAVDLGWKLSARLRGWGTESLLESYDIERRQVHSDVIESATNNVASLSERFADPLLDQEGSIAESARRRAAAEIEHLKAAEFRSLGLVLGYRYQNSPALASSKQDTTPLDISSYTPVARPGHLAPHSWLEGNVSLYDLLGPEFTLLIFTDHDDGVSSLLHAAAAQNIQLKVLRLTSPQLQELYGVEMALVRPDQHIAWSGDCLPAAGELVAIMRGLGQFS